MRVIAGKFRSQSLTAPKGWKTRPTSDRLRETLFNVLGSRVQSCIFADLFAGTGAVGIEALSRGARQVYFAENARPAIAALRANLEKLAAGPQAQVEAGGTRALLKRLSGEAIRLDIVFLDPPYDDQPAYASSLKFLDEEGILAEDALVIAEHDRRRALPQAVGRLQAYRVIEQSESAITFFRRNLLGEAATI